MRNFVWFFLVCRNWACDDFSFNDEKSLIGESLDGAILLGKQCSHISLIQLCWCEKLQGRSYNDDNAFLTYLNANVNSFFMFDVITLDQLEKVFMSFKNSSPGYDHY